MYESRLYIVDARNIRSPKGENMVLPVDIAVFECGQMPYDFPYLFKAGAEIDFDLYVVGCNENGDEVMVEERTDKYGEHCRMVKPDLVIKYIESHAKELGDYRRIVPLMGLLNGFDPEQWNNLMVVHYGH